MFFAKNFEIELSSIFKLHHNAHFCDVTVHWSVLCWIHDLRRAMKFISLPKISDMLNGSVIESLFKNSADHHCGYISLCGTRN